MRPIYRPIACNVLSFQLIQKWKIAAHDYIQIHLSFSGLDSDVVYPNGISCTLPENLQEDLVHTIPGLEQTKLLYPGTILLAVELSLQTIDSLSLHNYLYCMIVCMFICVHVHMWGHELCSVKDWPG